jgi:hypothetical protein
VKRPKTVIAGAAVTGAAVAVLVVLSFGFAGYSLFSGEAGQVNTQISSGVVTVALKNPGASQSLAIGAQNIAPGDTLAREVQLANTGTVTIGSAVMAITASNPSAALWSSANGLQLSIKTCSTPWSSTQLPDGGYTYACPGQEQTVYGPEAATSAAQGMTLPSVLANIAPGQSTDFVVSLLYPSVAGNSSSSENENLTWTFTATQAAGVNV